MSDDERCLSFQKGRHQYVFQYPEGMESELLAALVDLALDPDSDLDWFDAAVLSYSLGQQAARLSASPAF